jgi:RNA polymerase sigma-70 factor (ECF subfamily)
VSDPLDRILERVLVLRSQAGDEMAFAELVERYNPRLRYYLRKLLGDASTLDDALQDVWLDVFRGLGNLADGGAFCAWLYRIAHGRACRALRQLRAAPEPLAEAESIAEEADDDSFAAEDAAAVHAALDALPPLQREALLLRFLEEMSYEQIAAATDSHIGTVRSRIHYGMRALRNILNSERSEAHGRARVR